MNQTTVKETLQQLKGQLFSAWEKIAELELAKAKSNLEELTSHLQERYAPQIEQVTGKLGTIVARFQLGFEKGSEPENQTASSTPTTDRERDNHGNIHQH